MKSYLDLDKRTKTLAKNIGLTSVYRALTIGINFISIPLLIKLLGTRDYGIWIAISSILAWINFFDFGIGISLQNRLAKTIAQGKIIESRILLSSTYGLVSLVMCFILTLIVVSTQYINWSVILSVDSAKISLIRTCITFIAISISCQLVLKLVNSVLFAYQKTNLNELVNFVMQTAILIAVAAIYSSNTSYNPLLCVSIIYCLVPLFTFLIVNILVFRLSYRSISPSFAYVSVSRFKKIFSNSSNFLVLQLYGLVLFQTDNIIVANLFSPESVTTFSVTSKYFSIITIAFGVVLMPYWAATSEAIALSDFNWLKKTLNRNLILLVGLSAISIMMIIFSNELITIWTQEVNEIPISLSIATAFYTVVLAYNNIYGIILNAANLFRIQIILVSIIIVINIPLSYILVHSTNLGLTAIVISNLICVIVFGLFVTIQVKKLLKGSTNGIWAH